MILVLATYPADIMSVGNARHQVGDALSEAGLHECLDDVQHVVDELVWNVVLHAGTPAVVRLSLEAEVVIVEVGDGSHEPPRLVPSSPYDLTGRGLTIVDHLSEEWGFSEYAEGKVVWARLLTQPPARSSDSPAAQLAGRG